MKPIRYPLLALFVTLAACAASPTAWEKPCRPEGACDLAAVEARVVGAFDGLEALSSIECVTEPSRWCYSTEPDQDACLVIVESGAAEDYASVQNATPTQVPNFPPSTVSYFSHWLQKPLSLVFWDKPPQSFRERRIYTDSEHSLAVLVFLEQRCFNVDEVAAR